MRMAPNPSRCTVRSPPSRICPAAVADAAGLSWFISAPSLALPSSQPGTNPYSRPRRAHPLCGRPLARAVRGGNADGGENVAPMQQIPGGGERVADLSYAHGASLMPLLGETIGANLRRTAERAPDGEALVVRHQGYRATYRQLWDQVGRAARGLMNRGVRKGDRVGIWAPNRYEWVVIQYATARIGAILVNINPAYQTTELEYALTQSGVGFLALAGGFRQSDYVAMLEQVRGRCPALRGTLILDEAWDALLADADGVSEADLADVEGALQFDEPINIQYTSGTTGFPKGATLSHHNILNNGFFIGEAMNYGEQDRVCIPVPFY